MRSNHGCNSSFGTLCIDVFESSRGSTRIGIGIGTSVVILSAKAGTSVAIRATLPYSIPHACHGLPNLPFRALPVNSDDKS